MHYLYKNRNDLKIFIVKNNIFTLRDNLNICYSLHYLTLIIDIYIINIEYTKEKVKEMENPKTIAELKQWYIDRNLPSENVTRFFIGKNYKGRKAFGIYFDESTEDFIVYKNKANGERAIRYQGKNEQYAVNELFKKLKDEIYNQKMNNPKNYNNGNNKSTKKKKQIVPYVLISIIVLIIFIPIYMAIKSPKRGYYNYNNDYYYYQSGSWYQYNDYTWEKSTAPETLKDNHKDYYSSSDYYYAYGISDFSQSQYYIEPSTSSSSSSSSSSYDWDSGSDWDSGFTDWDSDW